jgi:hypothetical protein
MHIFSVLAQKQNPQLNIQVIDIETNKHISNVEVHSKFVFNQQKDIRTDFLGRAVLVPALKDTISFDHLGYYHLHIILDHFEPHDFQHPLKVYLTPIHHEHIKNSRYNFNGTNETLQHFEKQKDEHNDLKIKIIEDARAIEKRKSWIQKSYGNNPKEFKILDIYLRKPKN